MEDVRWPAEQLEEHRLEISNRIRNLFWTVSGDYDIEFEPDTLSLTASLRSCK